MTSCQDSTVLQLQRLTQRRSKSDGLSRKRHGRAPRIAFATSPSWDDQCQESPYCRELRVASSSRLVTVAHNLSFFVFYILNPSHAFLCSPYSPPRNRGGKNKLPRTTRKRRIRPEMELHARQDGRLVHIIWQTVTRVCASFDDC
jgi:hypothetical protein